MATAASRHSVPVRDRAGAYCRVGRCLRGCVWCSFCSRSAPATCASGPGDLGAKAVWQGRLHGGGGFPGGGPGGPRLFGP